MNRETSIYLDLVRIAAASLVFLSHASWQQNSGGVLWQLQGHGREAVDVFFVLSGFVIGHVVETREHSALTYTVHRAARVWSVALPALLITFALDRAGQSLRPELYQEWCCEAHHGGIWSFVAGAFFLNDIWTHHAPPGSNVPYWSLGYEVWYYVAFGVAVFARPPWHLLGPVLVMAAVGPGIAALFPLWLLGRLCYRLCVRHVPGPRFGAMLLALGIVGFAVYETEAVRYHEIYDPFELTPTRLHDYALDHLVGVLFAVHLLGFRALSATVPGMLDRLAGPARWLGGATFTLYLLHLPLIHALVAVSPWPVTSWATRGLVFMAPPVIVLALAEVTERRKHAWRERLAGLLRLAVRATSG
ncbi:acyltransferase family protein [Limobrevibacterium gyesilva]|uniref:Acyltransferase n=1 Tax=Limobrevibacterium gyesilva TaxID=2991712 RepID=A0AA41YX15_9PROT|nr:acyltransferase [Limobrevibacterium gyesilva]MCW3476907.1 acyltransferase [Limobrevibacterium gyesilva]